jgi:hypothetical protein
VMEIMSRSVVRSFGGGWGGDGRGGGGVRNGKISSDLSSGSSSI